MTMNEDPKFYTPAQVARRLGISVQSLKYHRARGHIQGTPIPNTNMYVYTEEQVTRADLSHRKPGTKVRSDDEPSTSALQPWDLPTAALTRAG